MSILVSINCITYNHEKYIADALESFLMQKTSFDFEILVGEDCSTDGTRKVVERYALQYPDKVKLITSDSNVGFQRNMLRLFAHSQGKYIAICEGDDFWTDSSKLQIQVDYMEGHPECSLCFHAAEKVLVDKVPTGEIVSPYERDCVSSTEDIILRGGWFPTASLLFPTKYIKKTPGFLKNAPVTDYPMMMILSSKGYPYYFNKVMAAYRIGVPGSWSSVPKNDAKEIEIREKVISLLHDFDKYADYRYFATVRKKITLLESDILLQKGNLKELRTPKYQEYYHALSIKGKIQFHARYYFPRIYKTLKSIRYRIVDLKRSITI